MQAAFFLSISCKDIKKNYLWFKHWTPSLAEGELLTSFGQVAFGKFSEQNNPATGNWNGKCQPCTVTLLQELSNTCRTKKKSEHSKVAMVKKLVKFSQCFIQPFTLTQVHHLPPLLLRHFKTSLGHADHFEKKTANYTS